MQERAAEELPYLYLYTAKTVLVHDARLEGLDAVSPTGDFTFLPSIGRR